MRCSIYHANRKHCAFGHGLTEGACTRSGRLRIAARHAQGGDVMLGEGTSCSGRGRAQNSFEGGFRRRGRAEHLRFCTGARLRTAALLMSAAYRDYKNS